MKSLYEIATDGGCHPNPGPGGYAFILMKDGAFYSQGTGRFESTTNNRVELTAVIEGLKATPEGAEVRLTSDSQYVVKGLNEWRHAWALRWSGVKNEDLWRELSALADARKLEAVWVRGHSGHPLNEACDEMATAAYRGDR